MSAQIAKLTGAWTTDVLPSQTTLTHINPAAISGIISDLYSASAAYPTITKNADLYSLARHVKGAKASLSVISAQHYIATATATQDFPEMTSVIWNATMELQDLEMGFNLYQMELSLSANAIFAFIFAALLVAHTGIFMWKHYLYFGMCFFFGTGLEFAGYVARVMAIGHYSEKAQFLCQIISLTLAPAFIMAGIYYLLAQLLVIYGRQYSRLRPLWFSYIFIFCDISSLFIQAAGGGLAAIKLQRLESTKTGTNIMIFGIAFQVVSMTLFLALLFEFLWRIYFRASPEVRFSTRNLFSLLFQTSRGRRLSSDHLFKQYNENYSHIWSRRIFGYYPLAILLGVLFIYIRCVYRLVELQEGWTGYLITHEEYVMTLDGLQVLLTCVLFIPFHPGFIIGKGANISMSGISHEVDQEKNSNEKQILGGYSYSTDDGSSMDQNEKYISDEDEMDTIDFGSRSDLAQVPVNPYFIPRVPIEPLKTPDNPFIARENEGAAISEVDVVEQSCRSTSKEKTRKNWHSLNFFGLGKRDVEQQNIISVPYTQTEELPMANNELEPERVASRKQARSDKSLNSFDHNSLASSNPYTRSVKQEELYTSGPYEQNGAERQSRNTQMSRASHGVSVNSTVNPSVDIFSQFTEDASLFSFGGR